MKNFYDKLEFQYSEKVIAIEDFLYGTMVKCVIPTLMPFIDQNKSSLSSSIRIDKNMIDNKKLNGLDINQCTTTEYIEIYIPDYLGVTCSSDDMTGTHSHGTKGTEFTAIFVGGDINNCKVIAKG